MIEKIEKYFKDDEPFEKSYCIEKIIPIEKISGITVNFTEHVLEIKREKPIEKVKSKDSKSKAKRVHSRTNQAAMESIQKKL